MIRFIQYRPPRIAMSLLCIAIMVSILPNLALSLHRPLYATALLIGFAGFALMIRAWWLFKTANTAICPTRRSSSLVTHDVFLITRNPMYLGMSLILAAVALGVGTAPFYVATLAYFLILDRVFCPYEEQKARQEFGDVYEDYVRHVRRWI
jgi:protein-S-isoprenylcysteine O-methyltransferase Ste14